MEPIRHITKTKDRLLKDLERVSDIEILEISDFVEFIIKKRHKKPSQKMAPTPQKDPILRLIGIVDVEPFSKVIDCELYAK
ncbi:MAG: hypothetical protein FJ110_13560 [Deltaproteobacteria bacterium]|nr:hypothetical protein [Deltaproteobacteria bacterium]